MVLANKSQKAGGSCGASNKMKGGSKKMQAGGGSRGAPNKMKGGFNEMAENKVESPKPTPTQAAVSAENNVMNGGSKKTKKSGSLAADEAVCFACRRAGKKFHVKMVDVKDVTKKTTKRTMKGKSGKCAVCGGKVFKIVGGAK